MARMEVVPALSAANSLASRTCRQPRLGALSTRTAVCMNGGVCQHLRLTYDLPIVKDRLPLLSNFFESSPIEVRVYRGGGQAVE